MHFSFIVPVYNCADFLPGCIAGIEQSGAKDYEILLINDGSTDGSGYVCDMLEAKYAQVHVIHQKNAGVSAARNRGIREAQGEYLLFVDADDTLLPFEPSVFHHLSNGVDMLIYGMRFQSFHKDTLVREEIAAVDQELVGTVHTAAAYFADLFESNCFSSVCNKIIRRSVLTENGIFFDSRLTNYEDLAFSLYVLSHCQKIAVVPEAYYVYRVNYDHDRTVDRMAAIDDLLGNMDLVAEAFMTFDRTVAGAVDTTGISTCLLEVYFNLFSTKMKTTSLSKIRRYCYDFREDAYIRHCMERAPELNAGQKRWYRWIIEERCLSIWLYVRYRMIRNFAAKNIKRVLGRTCA